MGATAVTPNPLADDDVLDDDTSAAIIRWLETARAPEGVDEMDWERWIADGCRGPIHGRRGPLTRAMLGQWARTGSLGEHR